MRYLFFISITFFCGINAFTQDAYWQQQVNYTISVKLNDADHTLDGFEKIEYINHSPDTLRYIYFHVWINAFRNDRTAYSEQALENGDTRFYFSTQDQKGYINQLDFRVNDMHAEVKDDSIDIDIIKVILPQPLLSGQSIFITTPFHVKLPYNFSRGGHIGQAYQITQWYPKPAVYDSRGWHPMPYLEQGEFYSEFGNYEVNITIPENYAVAATGILQNENEKEWLNARSSFQWKPITQRKKIKKGTYKTIKQLFPVSATAAKTLQYKQDNVHDFAWFADKRFVIQHDTCALNTGKIIDVYAFYLPADQMQWQQSLQYAKSAVRFHSASIGEYAYNNLSMVEGDKTMKGGMEYPTIALIPGGTNKYKLQATISHEAGHNWFYGALANNERDHPWMDEGMNTYYDNKYNSTIPVRVEAINSSTLQKISKIGFESVAAIKKDQPIALSSTQFTRINYGLSAYYKAGEWMRLLQTAMGKQVFDTMMHTYYTQWKFKHPYPEDFKKVVDDAGQKNTDSIFKLLHTNGSLDTPVHRKLRLAFIGKPDPEKKYYTIGLAPAIGFNNYDKLMLGAIIHNYSLPFTKFQFIAVPLYATGSKQFNGIGRATYSWYLQNIFQKIEAGISAAKFTGDDYTDSSGHAVYQGYHTIVPQLRVTFNNSNPRSQLIRYAQAKIYFISQDALNFSWDPVQMKNTYDVSANTSTIAQFRYVTEQARVLYPYRWELQLEASKDFMRLAATGNYFFNYGNHGGLNVRGFAGKFIYMGDKTSSKEFATDPYHLNMSAPKGYEDYTYSNVFLGRNEFEGFFSQQVMMRDGGFKVRTDLLGTKVAKTDDWLAALNFTSSLHPKIPVKLFVDIGTYSDAWKQDTEASRLLFDAGLQLSLCKDLVNIYVPLLYSKVYKDYYRSYPDNKFLQRISFSIDIQNIRLKKLSPLIPF
ncbi:MAG: M1 family metallopeptidase [Agriterribacter sp.]